MKHHPIHTKYHHIEGARMMMSFGERAVPMEQFRRIVDVRKVNEMLRTVKEMPRYVIYEDLVNMLNEDGPMRKSLNVIAENSLGRLPFQSVLVEFDEAGEITISPGNMIKTKVRHFVWLVENKGEGIKEAFSAVPWTLYEYNKEKILVLSPVVAACDIISAEKAKMSNVPIAAGVEGAGTLTRAVPSFILKKENISKKEIEEIIDKSFVHSLVPVTKALCALMVLLHTRGVAKDKIEVNPKWNASRVKEGKAKIQDHTVIRIGHTYNKDGTKREYRHGSPYTYPVYWVPGHVRGVRFGPKRSRIYDLFIEPYLVNYREGDEVPKPRTKEVTT